MVFINVDQSKYDLTVMSHINFIGILIRNYYVWYGAQQHKQTKFIIHNPGSSLEIISNWKRCE